MNQRIFICIFTFALLSCASFAQNGFFERDSASNQYSKGFKEGKWIEYLDSAGKTISKENAVYYRLIVYNAGKPYGLVHDFFPSGQLYFEGRIMQLIPEEKYDGHCRWFYDNGVLYKEIDYVKGEECGGKGYFRSGNLWFVNAPCVNGLRNGITKWYYDGTGVQEWETPYVNGKIQGNEKAFYESGALEYTIPYVNGVMLGVKKFYYENGKLKAEEPWSNGKLNGLVKDYNEEGTLKETVQYLNGKINGYEKHYDTNGKLTDELTWVNDTLHGIAKGYFPSGKVKAEVRFVHGVRTGIGYSYFESGKVESETPFRDGKINGVIKEYYESGKVSRETPCVDDVKSGTEYKYFETGELQKTTEWSNGMKNGSMKYYLRDGSLVHNYIYYNDVYVRSEPTGYNGSSEVPGDDGDDDGE
jgi:antitoxin component YwqK of YwqJK toxin-antitoxin module